MTIETTKNRAAVVEEEDAVAVTPLVVEDLQKTVALPEDVAKVVVQTKKTVVTMIEAGPKVKAIEEGPRDKAIEAGPKVKAIEAGPKVKAIEAGPKVKAIEEGPRDKAIEEGLKVKAIEEGPRDKAIEEGLKVKAIEEGLKVKTTGARHLDRTNKGNPPVQENVHDDPGDDHGHQQVVAKDSPMTVKIADVLGADKTIARPKMPGDPGDAQEVIDGISPVKRLALRRGKMRTPYAVVVVENDQEGEAADGPRRENRREGILCSHLHE